MRFMILGPLEIQADEYPVTISSGKARALLAMMLLNPGRVVTIEDIVDGIWAGTPPVSAIANIRTYAHRLRNLLRACEGSASRLASHPAGYQFHVAEDELDLLRFRILAGEGHRAMRLGRYRRAIDCLSSAMNMWRGRTLEDLPELGGVLAAKAVALEDQRWAAASAWADACTVIGAHEDLVPRLRQMVAERPLCEHTWAQLMVALCADGRRDEALQAYGTARRTLIEEIGVEPGAELRKMHLAVLDGRATTAWRQRLRPTGG